MVYFSLKLYLISYLQLTFPLRQFIDRFWIYFALYRKKKKLKSVGSTQLFIWFLRYHILKTIIITKHGILMGYN